MKILLDMNRCFASKFVWTNWLLAFKTGNNVHGIEFWQCSWNSSNSLLCIRMNNDCFLSKILLFNWTGNRKYFSYNLYSYVSLCVIQLAVDLRIRRSTSNIVVSFYINSPRLWKLVSCAPVIEFWIDGHIIGLSAPVDRKIYGQR